MMDRNELNAMVHQTTNPAQLAGFVGNAMITQENIADILENFGQHGIIWLELIGRGSVTQEQLVMASRIPDARVLNSLLTHRYTTREMKEWIQEYSAELAQNAETPEERQVFTNVTEYAERVLNNEAQKK